MFISKLPVLCILGCVLASASCGDDEPLKLFDEQGTWVMTRFNLDGAELKKHNISEREDKFMIHFNEAQGIVAAAGCIDSMDRTSITETLCDLDIFVCQCFNYTFEEDRMIWTAFAPEGGSLPPPPPEDAGVVSPGEPHGLAVELFAEMGNTYRYTSLPYGLFNSDGLISSYVFQARGDTVFMPTGCMEACGIAAAEPEEE